MKRFYKKIFQEKRKGPDKLIKITYLTISICWFIFLIYAFLLAQAQPHNRTYFDTRFKATVQTTWDTDILQSTIRYFYIGFLLSGFGIFLNSKRMKRKEDHYKYSLIFINFTSILGIIYYHFFF